MANTSQAPPDWMYTGYRLLQHDISEIREHGELRDWSTTTISQAQIEWQIEAYKQSLIDSEKEFTQAGRKPGSLATSPISLTALAARKVVETLESSNDLATEIKTVASSLNADSVRSIIQDVRTPYRIIKAFQTLPPGYGPANASEVAKELTDIDDTILANERYLRSRGSERNKDGLGLLNLAHLDFVVNQKRTVDSNTSSSPMFRTIIRKDPPKGGFEFLNAARARRIDIQPDAESFVTTFHRVTRDILKGLDWSNIFIAGGSVLATLLHVDPSKDDDPSVIDPDLDVYIYGLGPSEANEKVKHIYEVWSSNLPAGREKMVVKNTKTITFLASYPNRRVQIILKLVASPTSVLLNFDLDACALGFNGRDVLMLPRCARALETGYNIFTMDLIWGHHLGDRRASQETRIFKYASRGYGMRMLPSYIKAIESDFELPELGIYNFRAPKLPRKPNGPEPGLKTLKRIAFVAQDSITRFYFENTEIVQRPDRMEDREWEDSYEGSKADAEKLSRLNVGAEERGRPRTGPQIDLCHLDSLKGSKALPGFRRIISCFEVWMRHCEAWRLDYEGLAELVYDSFAANVYDPDSYDDLPAYNWSRQHPFDAKSFQRAIDSYNDNSDMRMQSSGYFQRGEYRYAENAICPRGYFERILYGPDLEHISEQMVHMILKIPEDLEVYLINLVNEALVESNLADHHQFLYPFVKHISPNLESEPAESELRRRIVTTIWVVDNVLMWAGIDRRIDEVFEVLWTLFHWCTQVDASVSMHSEACVQFLAQHYRSRLPRSLDSRTLISSDVHEDPNQRVLPERERLLYLHWLLRWPEIQDREETMFPDYDEIDAVKYPPPDEFFWNNGDEGINDGRDHEWITIEPIIAGSNC